MDILIDNNYKYWIASLNGLIEYDGNKLKTHHIPSYQNGVFGSDYIDRILFENDSTLWLNHISGVSKFNINTKKIELIKIPQASPTAYLNFIYNFKDSEGNLFFISNELKVLFYDKITNSIKTYDRFNHDSLGFVFKITEIESNNYLLHTRKGFYIYDKIKKRFLTPIEIPNNYQWILNREFKAGVNDYVRIGNDHFVSTFIKEKQQNVILKYNSLNKTSTLLSVRSNKGRLLFKDSFDRLWLYGFGDIAELYDPKTDKLIKLKATGSVNRSEYTLCYKVFEDHENNIWLCTNAGLLTFNLYQNDFEVISKDLPSSIFGEIEQINNDVLWFGSAYNGIYEYNYKTKRFKNYNFLKETGSPEYNDIWQLYKDKKSINIWIIHTKGRLSRYNFTEDKFYHYNDTIFDNQQISIAEDKNGNVFFVTEKGKLIKYNPITDNFETILSINTLKGINRNIEVNDIVFVDANTFVIGTSGDGLIKIDHKTRSYIKITAVQKDPGALRSNIINILKTFDDEYIFAGTTSGISALNIKTNELEIFSYNEDFNLGFVYDITKDQKGNIIFIGGNELYMMNWKTKEIIDLGEKSNIFRTSCTNVYFSIKLNKLYVLSEESIYEVTLNNEVTKPKIIPVIYSLETYGKSYPIINRDEISLDKNSSSFRINFGSSTYKFKDDLEYFYNFNNEGWEPIATQEISFSNLTGGDYEFKLKVVYKGNRAVFSEKKLNIHLSKKFHQTVWFYLFIVIFVLSVFYIFYRVRLNQLLSIERVRLELSRDLHDDMGSTLSTINILSTMALRKIDQDTIATKDYLQKTSKYCLKMMDSMDDIVWSLNPANDKMQKIIYRMREFASTLLEPRNIKFVFSIDEKVNNYVLHMAIRRDFFLVFKEALNNAAKYAQCSNVTVEIEVIANNLILTISDNGTGFDTKTFNDGNGLTNMRKRAELLKGHLSIQSEKDTGTTVSLTINLKKL